jgi:hypothetical protein
LLLEIAKDVGDMTARLSAYAPLDTNDPQHGQRVQGVTRHSNLVELHGHLRTGLTLDSSSGAQVYAYQSIYDLSPSVAV